MDLKLGWQVPEKLVERQTGLDISIVPSSIRGVATAERDSPPALDGWAICQRNCRHTRCH